MKAPEQTFEGLPSKKMLEGWDSPDGTHHPGIEELVQKGWDEEDAIKEVRKALTAFLDPKPGKRIDTKYATRPATIQKKKGRQYYSKKEIREGDLSKSPGNVERTDPPIKVFREEQTKVKTADDIPGVDQLALKRQLSETTQKEIKLPKSEEDIDEWAARYPDVAAIVESIAIKKAREQSDSIAERVKALDEMQQNVTREKAENELLKFHPDFNEIKDTDDFHEWADTQPKWVQDALYENENDARSAARAIDLYKADMGITGKKKTNNNDAAKSLNTRGARNTPQSDESKSFLRESQVNKMTEQQYEKEADNIMEAIRSGKFIYDISGNAR